MRSLLFGLAISFVALVSACESETEPGQSSGSGASGSGTPASTSTGVFTECGDAADMALMANCRDCAEGACCMELSECTSSDCVARLGCEVACGDDAVCAGDCATMYPDGAAAAAVVSCLAGGCQVCAPPTDICGTDLSVGSPECDQCITDNCCTEVDACITDMDCQLCIESGEPDLCMDNTVYDTTVACFDDNCGTSCGG